MPSSPKQEEPFFSTVSQRVWNQSEICVGGVIINPISRFIRRCILEGIAVDPDKRQTVQVTRKKQFEQVARSGLQLCRIHLPRVE